MKIENTAFLIPIHPPKYHYMYDLLNKINANDIQIDIYLIFSNISDYDIFTMKSEILPIILPEPAIENTFVKYERQNGILRRKTHVTYQTNFGLINSVITYKKFFGLKKLADSKYEYIICCDSEIDILCNNFTNENINHKIKQIFDNKKIYAGYCDDEHLIEITQKSAEPFVDKYKYLKHLTNDFTLYFWYSDLPVYRRSDIKPFFNIVTQDKIDSLHYIQFDYLIYQYYLMLFHGFEIINTTSITNIKWSLEMLYTDDITILNKLLDIQYGFSLNTGRFYRLNRNFVESQKGFLVYDLDRYSGDLNV